MAEAADHETTAAVVAGTERAVRIATDFVNGMGPDRPRDSRANGHANLFSRVIDSCIAPSHCSRDGATPVNRVIHGNHHAP